MLKLGNKVLVLKDDTDVIPRREKINKIGVIVEIHYAADVAYVEFSDGSVYDYFFWEITNPFSYETKIEHSYEI